VVGLGDNPDSLLSYRVGDEDAPAVPQRELVLSTVTQIQVDPISGAMAGQEEMRILTVLLQQL